MKTLQEKIDKALTCKIIGSVEFSDDEIKELKASAQGDYNSMIRHRQDLYYIDKLIILFISLAKEWAGGDNRQFWSSLSEAIYDNRSIKVIEKIRNEVERLFRENGKQLFISASGQRRFCEFIQYHAFVPKKSFEELVRWLWSIYLDEDILNANYHKDDPWLDRITVGLQKLFKGIDPDTKGKDDDILIDEKTYSITASLRYAFKCNPKEDMMYLVDTILTAVNRLYHKIPHQDDYVITIPFIRQCAKAKRQSTP